MLVSCERCATEYDFDPTLIAKGGTKVRCTSCGHVFRVFAPEAEASNWTVRTQDGEIYEVASIGELKARIAAQELSPDDEIRKGDEPWKALGQILELAPHFEAARGLSRGSATPPSQPPLAPRLQAKATLIGVGLPEPSTPPPPLPHTRATVPDLAPPPPRTPATTSSIPPKLPAREEVRSSAITLPPTTWAVPEAPPTTSSPTTSTVLQPEQASRAWFEAPSPDEPFEYRPSEPLIRSTPPLRLDEPPPRPAKQARKGLGLRVLIPIMIGLGVGVGVGLRHHLPPSVQEKIASIQASLGLAPQAAPAPAADVDEAAPEVDPEPPQAPDLEPTPVAEPEEAPAPQEAPEAPSVAERPAPAAPTADEDIGFDGLIRRGERALERGRTAAARRDFERALELRPGAPEALTGLGYVALDAGSASAAVERFRAAARAGYAEAYVGLGEAYRALGKKREALEAYERYLERSPGGSSASVARAQVNALRSAIAAESPPSEPRAPNHESESGAPEKRAPAETSEKSAGGQEAPEGPSPAREVNHED